jgi:hypothetical protein
MHWNKAKRVQRRKLRRSEINSASQTCLTYEEMLEISAERERSNFGCEDSESQSASMLDEQLLRVKHC